VYSCFRLNILSCAEVDITSCFQIIAEPANKATMLFFKELVNFRNDEQRPGGMSSLGKLDVQIDDMNVCSTFKAFSQYFETFNKKIGRMITSNILAFEDSLYQESLSAKHFVNDPEPQSLTLAELSICFYAFLIPLFLAIVGFIVEVLIPLMKTGWHNLFGLIAVTAYFRTQT
jgi:hypothetical protein